MGGRAKQRELLPDTFAWLKEVSDDRLNRYGQAGKSRYLSGSERPDKKTGVFDAVWENAAIEYRIRHGVDPEWSPLNTPVRPYLDSSEVSDISKNLRSMTLSYESNEYIVKEKILDSMEKK